jgi:hypothetical protein
MNGTTIQAMAIRILAIADDNGATPDAWNRDGLANFINASMDYVNNNYDVTLTTEDEIFYVACGILGI